MDWSSPKKDTIASLNVVEDMGADKCGELCRKRDGCKFWNTQCYLDSYFCFCFTVTDAVYLCEEKKGGIWSVAGNRNSKGESKEVESISKCDIL